MPAEPNLKPKKPGSSLFCLALLGLPCFLYGGYLGLRSMLHPGGSLISSRTALPRAAAAAPKVPFSEIASESGIQFIHNNGATGEKLLPETMGSGVLVFDFDGDGKQDLFFVNACYWPGALPPGKQQTTGALYQNIGNGKFKDVTRGSGLDVSIYGVGVSAGDYDNDGLPDIFITAIGGNHLFHNEGNGHFKETTLAAGTGGRPDAWSTSSVFFDYDNDGKLDLFVCNYIRWTREMDLNVDYKLPGIGRAYGPPRNFSGDFCYLYHNDGNGKFTDVSEKAGIRVRHPGTGAPLAKALGVAAVDLDGDGFVDLVVANDTVQNFVFHNEKNGQFREIGATSGLAYDPYGATRGAMGIDSGKFQADETLGISIGNFANEMTALYVARQKPMFFSDEAISQGIGNASKSFLTFGVFFFDYDLDGWADLLTVNGHIEPEIAKSSSKQNYFQPPQLFWNARGHQGQGFVEVTPQSASPDLFKGLAGRGSAFGDFDNDGDLDVVITQVGSAPVLLRNDQSLHHHWIRLKLEGRASNRDAIGAWVDVKLGKNLFSQQVMPSKGYLSQSELPLTFGLGASNQVQDIKIRWPSGKVQLLGPLPVDQLHKIIEP